MKILVLEVPGLHLGYLGCYGNDWVATPNIDALASASVVCDRHIFDVAQPEPFAWTGHHPMPFPQPIPFPAARPLGQILTEHGIRYQLVAGEQPVSHESLGELLEKTLSALGSPPAVLWVRFPDLAPPWEFPVDSLSAYCEEEDIPWRDPPCGSMENVDDLLRLQNTYAAVVTHVDAHLGAIIDALREARRLDETLILLTSASALPLGEHGIVGRARPWPHEEFIHLPLLLRLPGSEGAGLRLDALTQPVDLVPTLLEFLRISNPPSHGQTLWPLLHGQSDQVRPYACSGLEMNGAVEWSLRTLDWAFLRPIHPGGDPAVQPRLYVKPEDRWEVNNVGQHHQDMMEALTGTLAEFAAATRKPGTLIYPAVSV